MTDRFAPWRAYAASLIAFPCLFGVGAALLALFVLDKHELGLLLPPDSVEVVKGELTAKPLAEGTELKEVVGLFMQDRGAHPFRVAAVDIVRNSNVVRIVTEGRTQEAARKSLTLLAEQLTVVYRSRKEAIAATQQAALAEIDAALKAFTTEVEPRSKKGRAAAGGDGAGLESSSALFSQNRINELGIKRDLYRYALTSNEKSAFQYLVTTKASRHPVRMGALGAMAGLVLALARLVFVSGKPPGADD